MLKLRFREGTTSNFRLRVWAGVGAGLTCGCVVGERADGLFADLAVGDGLEAGDVGPDLEGVLEGLRTWTTVSVCPDRYIG